VVANCKTRQHGALLTAKNTQAEFLDLAYRHHPEGGGDHFPTIAAGVSEDIRQALGILSFS
jgi:hypothetical protein